MTAPASAGWPITPDEVTTWLHRQGSTSVPADVVALAIDGTAPFVQECRPDLWAATEDGGREYRPDGEVRLAAVMLAARVVRRRASPAGLESYDAGGIAAVSTVARWDPDVERALRIGAYLRPQVG